MLENLKYRWLLILGVISFSLYFIYPTFSYYVMNNDLDEKKSIKLGLDLKGGVNIVLELDEFIFIKKLAKKKLSQQSASDVEKLLLEAQINSVKNSSTIIKELGRLSESKQVKLNKFYSNLSKSSNNEEIINEMENQKKYAMKSVLDVMRNRIEDHDQYGLGEPSIQQLGNSRLVVELAGISDVPVPGGGFLACA